MGAANISVLPEGCVSEIISLTSPEDACRASAVSRGFKSEADSDAVWERFLPPDYREVIARAISPVEFQTKKQLYFHLSDSHILIDHPNLSFMVDKKSGKKCYMLGARQLGIAWHDDARYWEWGHCPPYLPETRFGEVGMLRGVCWLDIRGKIATVMLSQRTTYASYLIFQTAANSWGLDHPAKTRIKLGGWDMETTEVYLERPEESPGQENDLYPRERKDGWLEMKLGEFYCEDGDEGEVEMSFEEVEDLHWKHGLIVAGMELRPK